MPQPKSERGYRLGIVNPLTLVGTEIQTTLRERSFPYDKLVLLDSTGEDVGALTEAGDEPAVVTAISDIELEDLDLVFFCGPAAANRKWIGRASHDKFAVIDLSQLSSAEEGKLIVAGVNLEDLTEGDTVLISPHPVAIPITLILHQIGSVSPVELCTATIVQPASEHEKKGLEELAAQTISVLNVQPVPKEVFDRQLAFNLYPATEHSEDLVERQIRSLVHPRIELALMITQGTIFHGHTLSVFIRTRDQLDQAAIIKALRANTAIAFPVGDQEFGTIDAAGRDEVLIGEVRVEQGARGFWVWAVCDNLRRSAALNGVLIAEKVLFGNGVN